MSKFTRIEVALKMAETGLVPVFYHADPEVCKQVMKACYEGGVRVFEYTNRGDFAHENFSLMVKYAANTFPELMLGAGSIVDAATAALYIQMGANFIVSPVVKEDIAIVCNRRKISWSPGCGTLTEISKAEELGAEVVKIFPGEQVGGPKFVAAIKGPCPWTSVMPTGGVEPTEESLQAWFGAGVHCVGIGSQLISKEVISKNNYSKLAEDVRSVIQIIQKIKHKK